MRTLRLALPAVGVAGLLALAVPVIQAQPVPDHLKCYKIKDALKLSGTLDLTSPQFGLEAGCKVSGAALFCVPAFKSNVTVVDRATKAPITPLPFSAAAAGDDRVCYKLRCPKPATPIPYQSVTDQFGNRTVTKFAAAMLCTPAVKGTGFCGNGSMDPGEECDGANLNGATCATEGFASGALACTPGCGFNVSGCKGQAFPATDQTTCWDSNGNVITCAGTGQDGDTLKGAPLAYVDNGDGTITDNNTGLVWEKHSNGDGSVHDMNNRYSWEQAFSVHVATLNGASFAGHTDWRVPNYKELVSILNLENFNPAAVLGSGPSSAAVSPPFNNNCAPECTVLTCSCTWGSAFWSSTTYAGIPGLAWIVSFTDGDVFAQSKFNTSYTAGVRAVRGGS